MYRENDYMNLTNFDQIASRVILKEAECLRLMASTIPDDFSTTVNALLALDKGRVVLAGIGKSGYIAGKIASSLASTGTPAFYVHPGEASHGDLGMITRDDIVIMLSNSGQTKELGDMITYCRNLNIRIVGITSKADSLLAKNSNLLLTIPSVPEVSDLGAPTSSALMMLALGDALVVALHEARKITKADYLLFHPGGQIGKSLRDTKP